MGTLAVEASDGGDDLNLAGLDQVDEADVDDRDGAVGEQAGVDALGGPGPAVPCEVRGDEPAGERDQIVH